MIKKEVLAKLIDPKKAAVLRVVLHAPEELYLKEISKKSQVSLTSTFRILQELAAMGILHKREWKTSKVYGCEKNSKVDFLRELFTEEYDGLQEFLEETKILGGLQSIILHGARSKNKANVLLIGESIDTAPVDGSCQKIKEKGFEISYLTLTKSQYAQMTKMGLYSGEKKVLR